MQKREALMLIEVLLAIFIIAIGLLALIALLPAGALQLRDAIKDMRTAHAVANAAALAQAQSVRQDPTVLSTLNSPIAYTTPNGTKLVYVDPFGVTANSAAIGFGGPANALYGSATSASSGTVLTDSSKTSTLWPTNQWRNWKVQITSGTAAGAVRTITANTATTLTFNTAVTLALGDRYQILGIPRCGVSYSTTPAAHMRWFTLQDDIRLSSLSGVANMDDRGSSVPVRRESRYSWAYLFRQLPGGDSGTSSSVGSTTTTLVDTTKAWVANQWVNKSLFITSGPNYGTRLRITGNGPTSLTFTPALSAAPNATSYQISVLAAETGTTSAAPPTTVSNIVDTTKAWLPNQWQNWKFVVTGGPGVGGTSNIVSNTATALTLNPALAVSPNVSSYQIVPPIPATPTELAVVVYRGRSTVSPPVEAMYPDHSLAGDISNIALRISLTAGDRVIRIPWSANKPDIQRGTWLLDATNGYFYRAVDATDVVDASNKRWVHVDIDTPVRMSAPDVRIAIMDGVVEVFERGMGR